jgi:hypothetical protein
MSHREQIGAAGPWKSISMVLIGIVIGCATSTVARESSTAHAEVARPAAWEHMCMGPSMSVDGVNDDVKRAGSDGWELAAMFGGIVCFKRPV